MSSTNRGSNGVQRAVRQFFLFASSLTLLPLDADKILAAVAMASSPAVAMERICSPPAWSRFPCGDLTMVSTVQMPMFFLRTFLRSCGGCTFV
jgi:hypothetical protein